MVGENAFASVERGLADGRVRIGAEADNDLVLAHQSVSGHHAEIHQSNGVCTIRDLGSTNGTFLNGSRITTEQRLTAGDKLRFGAARFALLAASKPAPSIPTYLSLAIGLLVLAAAGFLMVLFVGNWEKVEELAATPNPLSTAPKAVSMGESPGGASTAASLPFEVKPSSIEAMANAVASAAALVTPAPGWLAVINEYRAGANLAPVVEDPKLSDADRKHAKYVVKNYEDKVSAQHLIGAEMHDEEKGNPWYTPEGAAAGVHSNVNQLWGHDSPPSIRWALDGWMAGPFHRLWMLNPRLQRVGYGEFCEKKYCVAALDLGDAIESPRAASPLKAPIEFPADNSVVAMNSFSGEWPSPLTSCPGYKFPAGLPATIQLGSMVAAKLTEYQILREGKDVEACGIDALSYENPVGADEERGRAILLESGAAIIIPRNPLQPGKYSVTARINEQSYHWSFTVGPEGRSAHREEPTSALNPEAAGTREADPVALAAAKAAQAEAVEAMLETKIKRAGESAFPKGPGAIAPLGPEQWLVELNRYREAVGVGPVTEDPNLSDGDRKHARYIVLNYPRPTRLGEVMHTEDPSKPGYTPEGLAMAGGDVCPAWYRSPLDSGGAIAPLSFVNGWLSGPFHRATLLVPNLSRVGFGEFCAGLACAAGLYPQESIRMKTSVTFAQPVLFPPPKYPIALIDSPEEWPDPLTSCPGYSSPMSLAITLQLGMNLAVKLSSYTLSRASGPVEACGFDWATYANPNASDQTHGRADLYSFGEVVILPRKPLERGATYDVSATVNDHPYQWSFTVSR